MRNSRSPLLNLPAEVRNEIYKHVFANVDVHCDSIEVKFPTVHLGDLMALPQTCEQIRLESQALAYSLCRFWGTPPTLDILLRHIGPVKANLITNVVIRVHAWCGGAFTLPSTSNTIKTFMKLQDLTGLKHIIVALGPDMTLGRTYALQNHLIGSWGHPGIRIVLGRW
jgi:hypothetical protein